MERRGISETARRAAVVVGWWLVVASINTAHHTLGRAMGDAPVDFERLVQAVIHAFFPWLLFWPALTAVARRFPLMGKGRRWHHIPIHMAAGAGFSVAHVLLSLGLGTLELPAGDAPWTARFVLVLSQEFASHVTAYFTLSFVQHAALYHQALREREVQASKLEAQLARAQLAVLRTQLQPHFLFNTLHAVSALMSRDVSAARRTLSRLSDLLRQSLDTDAAPEVPLREELEFLESYLDIQRTRFEDRLEVCMRVQPEALEGAVPRLLLQPLVENALRHGLEPRAEGGRVEVGAERQDGWLRLWVVDDGVGLPGGRAMPGREGVGLRSTRARLRALYGESHVFDFRPRPEGGVEVRLELPWQPATPGRAA